MAKAEWKTTLLAIVLVALASHLLGCSGGPGGAAKRNEVKIGAVLPLTGDVASWGQDSARGLDLALEQANAGAAKYTIRVLYGDSKAEAAEAVAAVRKLLMIDKVVAVVGDNVSGTTIAMVPIVDGAKVPLISPSASSPVLSGMSRYFFRVYPSDSAEGAFMGEVARSRLDLRNAVILCLNNESCTGLRDAFKQAFERLGGKVVDALVYNEDETDFRPYLTRLKAMNPDVVYLAGYYKDGGAILRQARELGVRARFLGSTTHENPELVTIAGDAADNLVYPYSTGYDAASQDPAASLFRTSFQTKYSREPGVAAALAYDCGRLLAAAIAAVGPSPDGIRDHLSRTQRFQGASGEITFDANGDVHKAVSLKVVKGGQFVAYE